MAALLLFSSLPCLDGFKRVTTVERHPGLEGIQQCLLGERAREKEKIRSVETQGRDGGDGSGGGGLAAEDEERTGRLKVTETELVRGGKDRQTEKGRQREGQGEPTLKGCVSRWRRVLECLNVLAYVRSQVVKCPQHILTNS